MNLRRMDVLDRAKTLGVIAALVAALGTIMPWLSSFDPDLGTFTRPGIDSGGEGLTVLALSIVGAISMGVGNRFTMYVAAATAAIALLLSIHDLSVSDTLIAYEGLPGTATVGIGLYVSIAASAVLIPIALYGARIDRTV